MCILCDKIYERSYEAPSLITKSNGMPYNSVEMRVMDIRSTVVATGDSDETGAEPIKIRFCPLCGRDFQKETKK